MPPSDKPNLYWKMNIDRFDFSTLKDNSSGYLMRQAVNRFPRGDEISDKDCMFRNMYFQAVQTNSLDALFKDIPLTFSFRMNEAEYEEDLQSFCLTQAPQTPLPTICRLFLSLRNNSSVEAVPAIRTQQSQSPDTQFQVYFELPPAAGRVGLDKARAASMPPRGAEIKTQEEDLKPQLPKLRFSGSRRFRNIDISQVVPTPEFFGTTFGGAFAGRAIASDSLQGNRSFPPSKNMWIIKPSGCDRGKGVEIFSTLEQLADILNMYSSGYNMAEFKDLKYSDLDDGSPALLQRVASDTNIKLAEPEPTPNTKLAKVPSKKKLVLRRPKIATIPQFVIQKYMEHPALWRGHKFDIRAHALLTQDNKLYVFRDSYIRVCSLKYTLEKQNYFAHLCNTSVNMRSESFGQVAIGNTIGIKDLCEEFEAVESDTQIGRDIKAKHKTFEEYLFKEICRLVKLAFDAVMVVLLKQMIVRLQNEFNWYSRVVPRPSTSNNNTSRGDKGVGGERRKNLLNPGDVSNLFELFGFDIMLTCNYKPVLIEANFIPGLTDEDNEYLKKYLDRMVDDMFKLTVDQMFPCPKNGKRTVGSYPFQEHDDETNLWIQVGEY